ncbi:N-acetylmuramic acid 6-phosphate phosphatase MupP [soil metagenome]
MPRFQTVVFDFDGTIASTLPLIYRTFNAVIEPRIGKTISDAELRSHFGPPDNVILGRYVGEEATASAFAEYIALYERDHSDYVHLFDGMREILVDLKAAGSRIGIMTGKSRISAKISLRELGIADLIEVLVAGDDVVMPKPHPEGVIAALAQLGHQPGETGVMIGDSAADIFAGRDAGVSTIAVTWGVPEHDELHASRPDVTCDTTPQLRTELGLD